MMRSLWTAASGMVSQQFNIDTISNNLSNVNTTGYKRMRAEFEDLIYQTLLMAGTPATEVSEVPTGIQVGHGSRTSATQRMFGQGSLQSTENKLDIALEGEGFFKVQLYDGTMAYTRAGSAGSIACRSLSAPTPAAVKSGDARHQASVGRRALRRGNTDEAERSFHRALAIDARASAAMAGLADVYAERGMRLKALRYARMAADADPGSPTHLVRVGDALASLGRRGAARREYERAMAMGSTTARGRVAKLDRGERP